MLITVNNCINGLLTAILLIREPRPRRPKSTIKGLKDSLYKQVCILKDFLAFLIFPHSYIMRYTRSQAHARAAEEAQALLLQLATPSLPLHSLLDSDTNVLNVSLHIPTVCEIVPKASLPVAAVRGLPVASFKKKQERYGIALRVQCVTLFDAKIPLDVICSRWFVTRSAVYR
jgi:hypothetical protein